MTAAADAVPAPPPDDEAPAAPDGAAPPDDSASSDDAATSDEPVAPEVEATSATDDAADDEGGEEPGPAPTGRWRRLGGLVLFAYVAFLAVDLSMLSFDPSRFSTPWRLASSLGGRLVLCVVLVAGLGHGLAGLASVASELFPPVARRPARSRFVVQFLTSALALPGCLLVLAPWIRGPG